MVRKLRRRTQDERGAVLVIVAGMLVVFMAMAALAIDLGSFYQAQRQAQSAADAGALAGAGDLGTNPAAANGDATALALQNFPGATVTPDSTSTANQVTVIVSASTPVFFGKFLGLSNETVSARAVAGRTTGSSCSNPVAGSSNCGAIFASDSTCTDPNNPGISFSGGGMNIQGGIWSDGSVSAPTGGAGGVVFSGPLTVGNGTGCAWNGSTGGASTPTRAPATTWPIDYSLDFPSCTGSACTGPSGTPGYCTLVWSSPSTWNLSPATNNIYCDVGNGTPSTPSTWTHGAINASVGGGTTDASYIAGSVSIHGSSNAVLRPCGYAAAGYASCSTSVPRPAATLNYPLIYALASGGATISGGSSTVIGDVFAPTGTISFSGGNNASIGFLEGFQVAISGGGISGDGPAVSGTGTPSGSSVALTQ
jgi:Flp pilus assembly protein TadG